jgi:hypothetical protein
MTRANTSVYVSIHEQRVKLVADAIVKHSSLDQSAAIESLGTCCTSWITSRRRSAGRVESSTARSRHSAVVACVHRPSFGRLRRAA